MATPKPVQKTPPISPAIDPQQSPRNITHSLSFPLTFHPKTSSSHASITSKFSHLKEKILSGPIALAQPTTSAIKRSVSLRNTARRLSIGSFKTRPEMAVTVPGRRKGVAYAVELTDTPTLLTSDSCATTDAAGSAESAATDKDKVTKIANNPNPSYIPIELINGLTMMRITHKKRRLREFKINPITFELSWDSKSSSRCSIDFIEDIREGEEAKYYRESLKVSSSLSSRWATILYNFQKDNRSKPRLLHVVAQSMEDFRLFIGTLKRLAIYRQAISRVPGLPHEELLEDWTKYASPVSKIQEEECVTMDGIQKILHKFYIYCSDAYLKTKFNQVNASRSGVLTFSEFERLVQLLKMRPEVEEIFHQNADMSFPTSGQQGISKEGLLTFCRDMQKMHENEGSPTIDRIFERFSITEDGVKGVTVEGFSQLLLSETYMPFVSTPVEDLTRPLTDYFISSSHNTYLVGRQLAGESSIEPYIKVLEDSCRCLEIDCWDGDDGPIVNHGRTFTSSVSFESVINAINHYAFKASSLPVILSLEVHCNIENQSKMVDIMVKTFGDKLVTQPLKENETSVPSPLELRNRILVKVKATSHQKPATGEIFGTSMPSSGSSVRGSTGTLSNFNSSSSTATATSTPTTTTTTTTTDSSEKEDDINKVMASTRLQEKEIEKTRKDAAKRNISEKLGSLGVYFQGIKFRNFALPISKTYNHVFSLSELKINAMIKDGSAHGQLVKHNKRYFLRVYPSGYRVTSTNFDPIVYWKRGVQMVSLNWQTYDRGKQLNDAMFPLGIESTGFVLKPSFLRGDNKNRMRIDENEETPSFDPPEMGGQGVASPSLTREIKITIVSGYHLHRPETLKADHKFNPFVSIEVFGNIEDLDSLRSSKRTWIRRRRNSDVFERLDNYIYDNEDNDQTNETANVRSTTLPRKARDNGHPSSKESSPPASADKNRIFRTHAAEDNGFNPVWNAHCRYEVKNDNYPFAFLRFGVNTKEDGMFGSCMVRIQNLNEGYRHLSLNDNQGKEFIFSKLFIKIEK